MYWLPVNTINPKPFVSMIVCGPKLWAGQPGFTTALWNGKYWYDPQGQWMTDGGVELNADEVTHYFIPKQPNDGVFE